MGWFVDAGLGSAYERAWSEMQCDAAMLSDRERQRAWAVGRPKQQAIGLLNSSILRRGWLAGRMIGGLCLSEQAIMETA